MDNFNSAQTITVPEPPATPAPSSSDGDREFQNGSLSALQTQEQLDLLNAMDKLRAHGVSEFISLPQLVVCGDQSAGKSSVLEAITELAFPRKENLCTRFATQIVLRRSPVYKVSVSIIPSPERPQEEKDKLAAFKYTLKGFDELPELIENGGKAMGLGGTTNFSRDVLSIEISGPAQPHLTVVDLPGMIHMASQDSSDVQLVADLVGSYMKNPRTIILSVVTAMNDYQNQIVLQRAKDVDPQGRRTLGIITKPDTLPVGSEKEDAFISLVKNEEVPLGLGWHALRNRPYEERGCNFEERNRSEEVFFQTGAWAKVPRGCVGIGMLRSKLSQLLYEHIKIELPRVYKDIGSGLDDCNRGLLTLGDKRETIHEQRSFLVKISQEFVSTCRAAVDGYYEDLFFGMGVEIDPGNMPKRLRAIVKKLDHSFEKDIRERGHTLQIENTSESIQVKQRYPHGKPGPKKINNAEALEWVRSFMTNSCGRELSGTFNPLLIGNIFWEQSKAWEALASVYLNKVFAACQECLRKIIPGVTNGNGDVSSALLKHVIDVAMNKRLSKAQEELQKLFRDRRGHPISYNHYFTDNVQKSREAELKANLEKIGQQEFTWKGPKSFASQTLSSAIDIFSQKSIVNMEEYACSEILYCMLAYYKVASKTFIDNVAVQVIERHLLRDLWEIFSPITVFEMSEQVLEKIARESPKNRELRHTLETKRESLMKGLEACRNVLPGIEIDIDYEMQDQ